MFLNILPLADVPLGIILSNVCVSICVCLISKGKMYDMNAVCKLTMYAKTLAKET